MTPETLAPLATLIITIAVTILAVKTGNTTGSNNSTQKH